MSTPDSNERVQAQRTCVGCRKPDGRAELLRFVLAGDPPQPVPDVSRREGGRGVSVHPLRRCVEAAVRSGALARGLRTRQAVDAQQLLQWAGGQYARRIRALLGAARRSGSAAIGGERAREAIAARRARLLVVAGDAVDNRRELTEAAARLGASCLVHGDKADLGKLFGRETVAVVAVTDPLIAEELQRAARCAAQLVAEVS